jgi:hypothetical protein
MVEQQQSAMQWVKASNAQRENPRQEADHDAAVPEQSQEKRPLSFYEDRAESRDYGALKSEQAQAVGKEQDKEEAKGKEGEKKLTFYEDHAQEQEQDHSR